MENKTVYDILESLVDSGDLIAWIEMDAEVAFDCYRLNPDRYPDAYVRYPKGVRKWSSI